MPDARYPAAGSPPGKSSQRADLSPAARNQPIRIGTGQPYGSAKQEEQLQQARRLEDRSGAGPGVPPIGAAGPPAAPVQEPTPGGAPAPGSFSATHPRDILATIGGHPSNFPDRPITFGVPLGSPKTTSIHSVLADLEDLMHRAPSVPTTVVDLYQRLRDEAAQAGQPPAVGGPPT